MFNVGLRSPSRRSRSRDQSRKSSYRSDKAHEKSRRSHSPMHRRGGGNFGRKRFQRSPDRSRGFNYRGSSGTGSRRPFRSNYRNQGFRKRFSPGRNRRRSLSRNRSISPRRRHSSERHEDRERIHDRSRKSFERQTRSSPHHSRPSLSPLPDRKRRSSPSSRMWDGNQMNSGDMGGGNHHNDMYDEMMGPGNMDTRDGNDGMGPRQRDFSPRGRNLASDIDERMRGRSNSPYKKDRYMENEMNRNSKMMMGNEGMLNNQNFQGSSFNENNLGMSNDYINHERMHSDFNVMMEAPKSYTQEELKKITVDIYRNVPVEPVVPNKRLMINPEDVVIVRRSGEGSRPIFDRDDIKTAQQAKDGTFERRVVAIVNERSSSPNMMNLQEFPDAMERENFQVKSENFNTYGNPNASTRPSLNDRWHRMQTDTTNMDNRNNPMNKNPRQLSPCRDIPFDNNRGNDELYQHRSRSRSPNNRSDSRFSRRSSNDEHRNRKHSELYERRERFTNDAPVNRQFDQTDNRRRNNFVERRDQRRFFRRGNFNRNNRGFDKFRQKGNREFENQLPTDSVPTENQVDNDKEKTWETGPNGEQLPNFSNRPDKYQYQEWMEKPDVVPKGPSYFEHDNRGERKLRDMRGRGNGRARVFRGGPSRGRGFTPRSRGNAQNTFINKNKWSPNHWQHDMFERSPDKSSIQDNNPSSTTGNVDRS